MADITQKGFENLTGLSSVQTPTVPSGTSQAWIQVTGQHVRARFDGTDPTSSTGMRFLKDLAPLEFPVDLLKTAEFIEEAASATVGITYFGSDA